MESKQNDLMLNILSNPQFSIGDFLKVGLSANNTSLEDEDTYLNSDLITENPFFKNESGEFDKVKFHNIYLLAAKGMEILNTEPLDFKAVYSKYNIWADPSLRDTSVGYNLTKIYNPDRLTKSMITLGQSGAREHTPLEIAQSLLVWDTENLKWMDTPENLFSIEKLFGDTFGFFKDNFGSTKVMATYEEDEDVNGKKRGEMGFDESQILHYKGDYKLNENGTYYYRTLKDGENIYGKLVLHYSDILTREDSALNSIDFLDSDDIKKTPFGSFVKNAALIGAMFIPGGIGTAIAGATIFLLAMGLGSTLGKLALGSDSETMNWIEGLVESTNPINTRSEWSSIDYGNTGRNTTWTIENLLGMIGDVVGLLKQQRLLFKYSPSLLKGKWGVNEKNQQLLKDKYYEELQLASKSKVLSSLEKRDYLKAAEASTKLLAENVLKAADIVEDYMKDYYKVGEELSKAYMTLLTVNDIYGEAKEAGAEDFDAALVTAGYAAMEYALLSTDIGKWILPELRGERLLNKAMLHALTKDVKETFRSLGKAAGESDEAKRTYLQKLVDFGKSVCKGEFNVGLGKRAAFKDGEGLLKAGVTSVLAGATAEAVEETSEELLGDFSEVLYNGLESLLGKESRLKPFENVVDRYGMSFLGGFFGGGISSATFDFLNTLRILKMNYDEAMQLIIHKAHNNDLDGIYKLLDTEEIGNKNLSAKKFDKDSDGNVIWKSGDENDNLDIAIKNIVRRLLQLIQNTLNAHGGKTDDELLDIQTMKDLRYRALRNTTTAGIFILKYNETLTDLVKLVEELKRLNTPAAKAENGESDLKSEKNEDIEALRKNIEEKIREIDKKLDDFHSGAKAPLFMASALIESTPFIAQALMPSTFKVYAELHAKTKFDNISEEELKRLEAQYHEYLKSSKKDDLLLATKSYLILSALIGLNALALLESLKKLAEDPIISKLLEETSTIFSGLNFYQDNEELWLENFQKWAEGNQALGESTSTLVLLLYNTYREKIKELEDNVRKIKDSLKSYDDIDLKIESNLNLKLLLLELDKNNLENLLDEETYNNSVNEYKKEAEIAKLNNDIERLKFIKSTTDLGYDINNLDKLKSDYFQKEKENLENRLQDLIFKVSLKNANALADRILALGYINGAIKGNVIDKLSSMSKSLIQTRKLAEEFFFNTLESGEDLKQLIGGENPSESDIEIAKELTNNDGSVEKFLKLREEYLNSQNELDLKIELIRKLGYTPIMTILDNFSLNLGKGKMSKLFDTLEKVLSSTRTNILSFNLSSNVYKLLGEAERVLDLYIATLEGARIDTVDPFKIGQNDKGEVVDRSNVWGINKVINEIHSKSPKVEGENWQDLPEIEGEIADMMLEDAKRLKNTLFTFRKLYSINQGLKLNVLKRVSIKTHYLLYSRLLRLLTNSELPDKLEFSKKINSLTFLKELTEKDIKDWNLDLTRELEKLLEFERIQMEDAIFEYFLDKVKDVNLLKRIINPKNFVLNKSKASLLSETTTEIDDSSFIGYLVAKAALKTSSLLSKLKELFKDGSIAPLIGQEISIQLGLANILNGDVVSNFIKAYRGSLLEMSAEERKKFLPYEENVKEAYATEEGFKLFINDDLVPQYDNIIFIDGIPGAGKSKAVDAVMVKYLNAYHTDLVSKAWIIHGGDNEEGKISKDFAKDIGFGESYENAFDKKTFMRKLFPNYETPKPNAFGHYSYTNSDFIIDSDGKIQVKWPIDENLNKDNVPKIIFIDEAQQFTQIELLALDKVAKKFGISIIMSGDLNLSQIHADVNINGIIKKINLEAGKTLLEEIKEGEENKYSTSLTRNLVLHTPKLGTSMRAFNNQKIVNMANTEVVMENGKGNLELHYYEDEKTLAGDYQLRVKSLDDITAWIDKMIPLLEGDEKIHFALPKSSTFQAQLEAIEKYKKVLKFHEGVALGLEGNFWIIQFDDINKDSFKLDFYTGLTRSKKFSLMLVPDSVYKDLIKILNIKDLESHKEEYNESAIKRYSDEHIKILEETLPKEVDDIKYQLRTTEEPDSIKLPKKESSSTTTTEEKRKKREEFIASVEGEKSSGPESPIEPPKKPTPPVAPATPSSTPTIEPTTEPSVSEEVSEEELFNETLNRILLANTTNEAWDIYNDYEGNSEFDDILYNECVKKEESNNLLDNDISTIIEFLYESVLTEDTLYKSSLDNIGDRLYEETITEDLAINELLDLINRTLVDDSISEETKNRLNLYKSYIENELLNPITPEGDPFEDSEEPSSEEISDLEDLGELELKEKLAEDSGVITETEKDKERPSEFGFSLKTFKVGLYGNASFELGTAKVDEQNNTYELETDRYGNYRIDGVNGIENPAITSELWALIRKTHDLAKAELKLGYLTQLLKSQYLDKAKITELVAKELGLSGGVYIRYAIKVSSLDTNFESDSYLKLEKSPNEKLRYARALLEENSESNYVNNRNLVAIIGTELNGDVIEIPLLTLGNPSTIIKHLDNESTIRRVYERNLADKGNSVDALKAVREYISGNPDYLALDTLIDLFLDDYRHILFIDDINWTPGKDLDSLGVQLYKGRGLPNVYLNTDYTLTLIYNNLSLLRADPTIRITSIFQMTNRDGIISGEDSEGNYVLVEVAHPKHPFVLFTDQLYDHNGNFMDTEEDIKNEFLWQQLNDVPKTIQLVYVLPPVLKLDVYLNSLVEFMVNKGPSPFGNQRTAFKILETLLLTDKEATLQCFKDALGEEDGRVLFNKTILTVARISKMTKSNGEPDIDKQVKALTSETESWDLGNVGIPKDIPLYRQLLNVLKLLVYPQSVVMEEGEDGWLVYLSKKGSDKRNLLMPKLLEIFDLSGETLYHQAVGSKTETGLFIHVQTDRNGNFPTGEEWQINGNISSLAFLSTESFNKILYALSKKKSHPKPGMVTSFDTSAYVRGKSHYGWRISPISSTDIEIIPSIDSKIINKLKTLFSESDIENLSLKVKRFITKENDSNERLLLEIASTINSNLNSNIRAMVINGELLLGQSEYFRNNNVKFLNGLLTSRGYELEVLIDSDKYDGTFVNGELTLQQVIELNIQPNNNGEQNFDIIVDKLLELINDGQVSLNPGLLKSVISKINEYKQNPSINKPKLLAFAPFKMALKLMKDKINNFEDENNNDILTEEQKTCSTELKIKFN